MSGGGGGEGGREGGEGGREGGERKRVWEREREGGWESKAIKSSSVYTKLTSDHQESRAAPEWKDRRMPSLIDKKDSTH